MRKLKLQGTTLSSDGSIIPIEVVGRTSIDCWCKSYACLRTALISWKVVELGRLDMYASMIKKYVFWYDSSVCFQIFRRWKSLSERTYGASSSERRRRACADNLGRVVALTQPQAALGLGVTRGFDWRELSEGRIGCDCSAYLEALEATPLRKTWRQSRQARGGSTRTQSWGLLLRCRKRMTSTATLAWRKGRRSTRVLVCSITRVLLVRRTELWFINAVMKSTPVRGRISQRVVLSSTGSGASLRVLEKAKASMRDAGNIESVRIASMHLQALGIVWSWSNVVLLRIWLASAQARNMCMMCRKFLSPTLVILMM